MQKLQFFPVVHKLVGIDKATCYRSGVQYQVFGHAHQHITILTSVGEPAHGHTAQRKKELSSSHSPENSCSRSKTLDVPDSLPKSSFILFQLDKVQRVTLNRIHHSDHRGPLPIASLGRSKNGLREVFIEECCCHLCS